MDKVKNLFKRKSVAASPSANADAEKVTISLTRASPKVQAAGISTKATISSTQLAGLRVKK